MAFHGCDDALAALRKAAEASVGPFGLPGAAVPAGGVLPSVRGADQATAPAAAGAASAAAMGASASTATPAYSGTNDYEAGVDEPDAQRVAANRAVIASAGLDAWLPHFEETADRITSTGRISCAGVSRPATYTGANLLTVLPGSPSVTPASTALRSPSSRSTRPSAS